MRVIISAAIALSAPGRFSTTTGEPSCCASAAPMMRVVGSAEPPGGKPTMKRIGFEGYWDSAEPAQSSRPSASAAFDILFMGPPPSLNPTRAAHNGPMADPLREQLSKMLDQYDARRRADAARERKIDRKSTRLNSSHVEISY